MDLTSFWSSNGGILEIGRTEYALEILHLY